MQKILYIDWGTESLVFEWVYTLFCRDLVNNKFKVILSSWNGC